MNSPQVNDLVETIRKFTDKSEVMDLVVFIDNHKRMKAWLIWIEYIYLHIESSSISKNVCQLVIITVH